MGFRSALATLGSASFFLAACATAQTDLEEGPMVPTAADSALVEAIRSAAIPLRGTDGDYDRLVAMIGDAQVVLLGEATHGTHEFYRERARITRRLIEQHGFTAVAVEGDWPEVYPVNRYVRGAGTSLTAALAGFEDFPEWMWRNTDVVELVEWMRSYNQSRPEAARVGFYGLDMQTLGPAITAVTEYLESNDARAAERARSRFRCFARYRDDPAAYAQSVEYGAATSCERQVAEQLREFEGPLTLLGRSAAPGAREEFFAAAQNARLISSSEAYFRAMYRRNVSTWNMRDRYMQETLERLLNHLSTPERPARIVVWAHN
ncbi:MAG: erythromycin esterase family protein, partial [Gemmatimonadetes bacterium]|nr:erythromycin esterase family protein [Gemmatimonadota bacterium]